MSLPRGRSPVYRTAPGIHGPRPTPEAGRALRSGIDQCAFRSAPRGQVYPRPPNHHDADPRTVPHHLGHRARSLTTMALPKVFGRTRPRDEGDGDDVGRRTGAVARLDHASSAIWGVVGAPTLGQDFGVR